MPRKRPTCATRLIACAAALGLATLATAQPAGAQSAPAPAPARPAPAQAPSERTLPTPSGASISPVAFVNGDVITNYDVSQRARLLEAMGAPAEARTPDKALDAMIDARLKQAAARRAGLQVPPEKLDESISGFARSNGLTEDQLYARMRKAGVADETLRNFIENEVMWTSLIRRDYGPRADVTELDVDDEIQASGLDKKLVFELGEIAIPARGADDEAARRQIERIAAEINGGADFAAMARKYSRAPSAPRGGRMGTMPSDRLPPQLVAELRDLPPGHVTRPLGVPGGVVVLTVLSKTETEIELSEDDRERIRGQMRERRLTRYAEGRLQELRADAYIDRR